MIYIYYATLWRKMNVEQVNSNGVEQSAWSEEALSM